MWVAFLNKNSNLTGFTQATNVDESCVDALVCRGAACANNNNFDGALDDLKRALDIEPDHANALKYKCEILHAYGSRLLYFRLVYSSIFKAGSGGQIRGG